MQLAPSRRLNTEQGESAVEPTTPSGLLDVNGVVGAVGEGRAWLLHPARWESDICDYLKNTLFKRLVLCNAK